MRFVSFCLLLLAASGCATLETERASFDPKALVETTPDKEGVRYSLPKPFLQVTPNSDGTVEVEVIYLPDLDHTYTLQAKSKSAAHTFAATLENGMLTSVTWDADTSGVAEQAIDSGAGIAESLLEASQEREDEAQEELEEAIDEAESTLDAARQQLAAAELALLTARTTLDFHLGPPRGSDSDIADARLAVAIAVARVERAEEVVARAEQELASTRAGTLNLLGASQDTADKEWAPGPVLYAIEETPGKLGPPATKPELKLEAVPTMPGNTGKAKKVQHQSQFETVTLPKPEPAKGPEFKAEGQGIPFIPDLDRPSLKTARRAVAQAEAWYEELKKRKAAKKILDEAAATLAMRRQNLSDEVAESYVLELKSTRAAFSLTGPCVLDPASGDAPRCWLVSPTSVLATIARNTEPGSYKLFVSFNWKDDKGNLKGPVTSKVELRVVKDTQ